MLSLLRAIEMLDGIGDGHRTEHALAAGCGIGFMFFFSRIHTKPFPVCVHHNNLDYEHLSHTIVQLQPVACQMGDEV